MDKNKKIEIDDEEEVDTKGGDTNTDDKEDKNSNVNLTAKVVKYCNICTFPEEFCEYSHVLDKKIAREEKKSEEKTDEQEVNTKKEGGEGGDKAEKTDKDDKIDEKKDKTDEKAEDKKDDKDKKKKKEDKSVIVVTNHKRSKKKVTTTVSNVEKFSLNMKDVAKLFSKKFACSSSVTKENNSEFITLTGDFGTEIIDFLIEKFPQLKPNNFKFVENVHKD